MTNVFWEIKLGACWPPSTVGNTYIVKFFNQHPIQNANKQSHWTLKRCLKELGPMLAAVKWHWTCQGLGSVQSHTRMVILPFQSVFSHMLWGLLKILSFFMQFHVSWCVFWNFNQLHFLVLKQSNRPCELIPLHHCAPIILHTQTNTDSCLVCHCCLSLFGIVWWCGHICSTCVCRRLIRFGKFTNASKLTII